MPLSKHTIISPEYYIPSQYLRIFDAFISHIQFLLMCAAVCFVEVHNALQRLGTRNYSGVPAAGSAALKIIFNGWPTCYCGMNGAMLYFRQINGYFYSKGVFFMLKKKQMTEEDVKLRYITPAITAA